MLYSGTVGAVFEAACFGLPAVALSTEPGCFEEAMAALEQVKEFFIKHDLMKKNSLYNVNIPKNPKGIRITRMGGRYFADDFLPQGNDMFMTTGKSVWKDSGDYSIDTDAALSGYISVLPLTLNRTNTDVFNELKSLNSDPQ